MIKASRFFGNRQFYKRVIRIMAPVLLQNVITNFVSLLDNIMVGQVGTEPMSGVAIANQLIFIFNLCIFGGISGAGIFTAQYYGKGDEEGVRNTVRMKLYIVVASAIIFAFIFVFFGENLINYYLHDGSEGLDLASTFKYSLDYLRIMIIQLMPFAFVQAYGSSLRETGETMLPMKASIAAIIVNLVGNYILIFGKFGVPVLGVEGAAIATVIARFVECGILIIYAHTRTKRFGFFKGLYSTFKIPGNMVGQIVKKGTPLLINELLWAAGMAMLNQCYSVRGLEVVSATNISSTIGNLFNCAYLSIGSTIGIIVGQKLGAGKLKEAEEDDNRIIVFSLMACLIFGTALFFLSPLLAGFYNTTDTVKALAATFLKVIAIMMPLNAFSHACYFTLRTGGKTIITFIFDSLFTWVGFVSVAFILSRYTELSIIPLYIIVNAMELIKCAIGFIMLKSKIWIVNLVS